MGGEPPAGSGPGTHVKYGLAVCAGLMLLAIAACSPPRPDYPVIGAKNFTEQVGQGALFAQQIEGVAGIKVERAFYLAGSYMCKEALIAGGIVSDLEYPRAALTAIL